MTCCNSRRKPEWLKIKLPKGQSSTEVLNIVRKHNGAYKDKYLLSFI